MAHVKTTKSRNCKSSSVVCKELPDVDGFRLFSVSVTIVAPGIYSIVTSTKSRGERD